MLRFSANLSMLFTEVDFLDRFAAARAAGFAGVEYVSPYQHPREQIAETLARHDLTQVLFNMPAGDWAAGERGLACLPDRVGEFQDSVETTIAYAKALGCTRVNCLAGIQPPALPRERALQTMADNLAFAAPRLAEHGIALLIEPINFRDMPGYPLNSSTDGIAMIARCGAAVKLQYDIYHMQRMEGELAATIARLLPHIGHLQLADTPGRHEPGSGEINFAFLLPHIDRLGYGGWIGCEYHPAHGTVEGLAWLRPYMEPA
jgi:hydroxypyruvate isomerase